MNIFYLHHVPDFAAKLHCDQHVVKMVIECAQLLSTAHHVAGSATPEMYNATHINHPCAIWVRKCHYNYDWVYTLYQALSHEYTKRYGRIHKSSKLMDCLLNLPNGISFAEIDTIPPQCMPEQYQNSNKTQAHCVSAYRTFYVMDKSKFARYRYSPVPTFMK